MYEIDLMNENIQIIIDKAERFAKLFKQDRLKTNQLRNFYSSIIQLKVLFRQANNSIDEDDDEVTMDRVWRQLILLKPKLAYTAGKNKSVRDHFHPIMTNAINSLMDSKNTDSAQMTWENFFTFVESIVAYHKFHNE